MPKNIILCSDGTGNSGGKQNGTNVWRIYKAIERDGDVKQVAFHDDGVGTQSVKVLKIMSGAFGFGLSRNVRQLYTELIRNYEPGDRIYLFGFSRGAFTVRTLAGLILENGIIDANGKSDKTLKRLVKKIFTFHRRQYPAMLSWCLRMVLTLGGLFASDEAAFREKHMLKDENGDILKPEIEFMGVWDTVDAVGFPVAFIATIWNIFIYKFKFPDRVLGRRVNKACHALAIDDERHTFHPTLWDEKDETDSERVEQVWFAGVHSNVGGGYPKDGLAFVTLAWMMNKAQASGLVFSESDLRQVRSRANHLEQLYDSRSGMAVYYRYKPREIDKICAENHINYPSIHCSVFDRIHAAPQGYAPGNVPARLLRDGNAESAQAEALYHRFTAEEAGKGSQVQQVPHWKLIRMLSHMLLFVASIVIIYLFHPSIDTSAGTMATVKSLLKSLVIEPMGWLLLGALILSYSIGLFAKSRQEAAFSTFWSRMTKRSNE